MVLAQGTGAITITAIGGQSSVIEGYRHDEGQGNNEFLDVDGFAEYYCPPPGYDYFQAFVNGTPNGTIRNDHLDETFTCTLDFTGYPPCQQVVVEIEEVYSFGCGAPDWSEPIHIFVLKDSLTQCLPKCDDCNRSSTGQGAGGPVDIVDGKMYYSTTDFSMSGPNGIRFERYYDNQTTFNSDLGYGWRHTYSHYLDVSDTRTVRYYDNHGRLIIYGQNRSGAYLPDYFFGTKLTYSANVYTVTTREKTLYQFNSSGKLIAIIDRKGNAQTVAYDTNNPPRILRVTDAFGKQITFGYSDTDVKIQTLTTTPDSRLFSYRYDANGNLQTFTDPLTKIWRYEYDVIPNDIHNLTGVRDPLNHYLETHTYYYPDDTTKTSAKDGNQESLTFSYSPGTSTTTTLDSLNRMTTYTYDPSLKIITSVTGPGCGCGGNQTKNYTWDNFLRKLTESDANGNQTKFEGFDQQLPPPQPPLIYGQIFPTRNLHFLREAYGTGLQRDTEFRDYYAYGDPRDDLYQTEITSSVDTPGLNRTITFSYDYPTANLLTRQIVGYSNGNQNTVTENMDYSCTGHGLLCNFYDPRTNVTHYAYFLDSDSDKNRRGQLQSVTDAAGNVTTYASAAPPYNSYDVYGNPRSITDPNGVITLLTYDNWGRSLNTTIKADGNYNYDILTQKHYQDDGLLQYIIQPEGNVTYFTYDNQHRQTEIQQKPNLSGHGDKIVYQYDTEGNRTHEEYLYYNGSTWDKKRSTDFAYDSYNRLWKVISPIDSSKYTENLYDAAGNLQYVDDSNHPHGGPNHQFTYAYDALNRQQSATVHNNGVDEVTQYGFDSDNNIVSITDPDGRLTTEKYDDFGRNINTVSPDSGTTLRTFDPAGNLTLETDARNVNVTRTYDALNRNTSISYPNSGLNVTFTCDGAGTAYGKGRLTQMVDQSGTTNYTAYERRGLLITEQKIISPSPYTTQYAYNKNGAVISMTYPSGRTVTYSINLTEGRPQTVTAPVSGTSTNLLSSINYYPFGPVSGGTFSNGRTLSRTFDTKYRILTNTVSNSVLSLSYDYATGSCLEYESNIRCINDNLTPANNKTFTYDDRYQVKNTTGLWGTENYTYDKNGNRLTKVTNGNSTTYNYTSGTNRLSSTAGAEPMTYGYDANGNITSGGGGFTYGDHNRLAAMQMHDTYRYDARNLRVQKTANIYGPLVTNPSWLYFYDQQGKLIAEKDGLSGLFKDYIYLENEPIARIDQTTRNDTLYLYHDDHLGTPVAMTNSSGTVVLRTEYFAFGKVYSQSGSATNNLRFPGQYFDVESNLHQNWWRDYDPKIGRYREVDPVRYYLPLLGSDDALEMQSEVNFYPYARGNAVNAIDSSGMNAATPTVVPTTPSDEWKKKCKDANPLSKKSPRACKYGDLKVNLYFESWSLDCICKCMPDDPGSQCVRGCIQCAKDNGAPVTDYGPHTWCKKKCREEKKWTYTDDQDLSACAHQVCAHCVFQF